MSIKQQIRIECLSELLGDLGYRLSLSELEAVVDGFVGHLETEGEMEHNMHHSTSIECSECTKLKAKISKLEKDIRTYRTSIMNMHNATDCVIDFGVVMVEKKYY